MSLRHISKHDQCFPSDVHSSSKNWMLKTDVFVSYWSGSCPNISDQKQQKSLWLGSSCPTIPGAEANSKPHLASQNGHSFSSKDDPKVGGDVPQGKTKSWRTELEPLRSWLLLLGVIVPLNVMIAGDYVTFSIYYVAYAENFPRESRSSIGVIVAVKETTGCACGLLTGVLINRYGPSRVILLGGLFYTCSMCMSAFTSNIPTLYVTQGALSGIAYSFSYITSNYTIQKTFKANRGFANGIAMIGFSVGNLIGAQVVNYFVSCFGWRGALFLHGTLYLQFIPFSRLIRILQPVVEQAPVPNNETSSFQTKQPRAEEPPSKSQNKSKRLKSFLLEMFDFSLLKQPLFALVVVGSMFYRWNEMTFFYHMPSKSVSMGMTRYDGARFISIFSTGAVVCRVFLGFVSNLEGINSVLLYNLGYLTGSVGSFIIALMPSYKGQALGSVVTGTQTGISNTMTFFMLVDLMGMDTLARSMSLTDSAGILVALLAAPVGGYLYDVTGSYNPAFILAGSIDAVGSLLVLTAAILDIMKRRRMRKEDMTMCSE